MKLKCGKKAKLFILLSCFAWNMQAQLIYHDAIQFPLLGKATSATGAPYERLPDSLKSNLRAPLWALSQNSAGMAIRFRSNSSQIAVKWESLLNYHMNHMTDVGVKGLDLYCLEEDEQWRFVNSARPTRKIPQTIIIANYCCPVKLKTS